MRLFKPTYKDKKGKTKEVSKWWIELKDHNEVVRRFAGFADRAATEATGRNIERLISFRAACLPPDAQLVRWLEKMPGKLRARLAEVGLLDADRIAASKPLTEHIDEFEVSLLLRCVEIHARQTALKVRKIVEACKFSFWSDVKASPIESYVAERRKQGLSRQTAVHYMGAFKQFCLWMQREKRAMTIPMLRCERAPKNYGRAFELDEFQKLLDATLSGPSRQGVTGYERYLLYVFAVETGLRRGELRSLTPASFDFKKNTVFVSGQHTKNGEDAVQEFSLRMAALLKEFVVNKMPGVKVFRISSDSARIMQADCRAAGIEVVDNAGRRITFHSLRHTCGTFLAAKGVHPKLIQDVMRHKDINMTMNRYCHVLKGQRRSAIESLPDFSKRRATGTK